MEFIQGVFGLGIIGFLYYLFIFRHWNSFKEEEKKGLFIVWVLPPIVIFVLAYLF